MFIGETSGSDVVARVVGGQLFTDMMDHTAGIWSTQWTFALIKCNGLSISSTTNLVQNIGFNNNATTGTSKSFRKYERFFGNDIDNPGNSTGAIGHRAWSANHLNALYIA